MNTEKLLKAKKLAAARKNEEQFFKALKDFFEKEGISISQLSRDSHIDCSNICDILNNKGNPTVETLYRLLPSAKAELVVRVML